MPTYRFQSEELGVDYNIDFENVPTKKDFYDVLKSQVDTKQVANLIDSPKGKALAVDAYRHGFFDENTPEVGWSDVGDIVMDMAESAWSGLGKIAVDRPVIKQRTQDLAVRLGGVEKNLAYGKTMQEYGIKDVKRDVDFDTSMKLDQAGVRLLDRATILDKERSDFGDGMDYVQQSLAYVGLDPNDKDLQAEVARRTFRFSEATDKASLYQGLIDNVAGYRMLGSLGKRELSQSDWFKSEQSDDDIVEEIRHLREMQVIGETLDRGAETMARVLGDTKTAQQIKKGLVSPDKDIALMTEMLFDPAEYIAPGVARATQMTLRGLGTPGQIRRLANKQKEAVGIKKEAIKDLAKRQEVNSRSPDVSKEIQDASEEFFKKIIKDQNKVILETSKKLTGVLGKTGGPPSLQKGAGFVTRATGYSADLVGRTAEFIYSAPKELAVDLLVKSGMTTEGAESLLKWGTGIGAGVGGASLISNDEWKPEWTDALVGAGILLGPRALQAGGTTMRHLGDYWSQGAGTRNMFEYLQQMDVAPKLSGAIIDRTTDSRMLPGVQEASKAFTKGETLSVKIPGITENFNKRQALPSGVRSFARGMTATGADKVASFAGRTGIAGATAMALPGAIGYATGGIEGMAGSIGASLPFIGLGLGSGELMRHKSKADLQIKQRGDVTAFRKNLDDIDGMLYDKLSFESKAGIASASIKYPDLEIGFYDAPGKANGFYDEPKVGNRSGKVMINVSGDAPLIGILSHEVGHHIMRHGMQPLIHEIFFGSVAKEKGGVFTAKDADGNPIIEYENGVPRYKLDEATFGKARDEYLSRLEDTQGVSEELRDQYTRNPEAILDEVVAEHVAHMLMKDKYGESILDKNVGDLAKSLFSAISGKGFIRDAGVGMGLASDEFGNGIFSAIEENSQLTKLVNDYNKLSERRSRQEMEDMIEESSSDVAVDATDLKSDAKLQDLFDGAIMRDDDGNIVRDVSGAPKLMTNGQMNKKQEQMSSDLSNLIDRMNDEDKADGHVIMRDTADGGRTGEGMFIDESIIDALAQGGNYSASQINFLRQASAVGRAISNGDITGNEVLMFYYPATRGGRKYKSLRGGFRSALIWGLQVSKAGNVNIQTLSLTGIENNLSRMLKTKKYTKMLSEAFGAETNQGIRQAFNEKLGRYLENQHKGIENGKQGSGLSVEEKNMINAMLGENVKMQGELNPVFAKLGFRPETTIRSRRIDRIGTIQTTGKGAPVTYNGIKRNLMPRKGKDSQGQQTIDFGGPRRVSDESVDVRKIARDIINKLKPQSPNNLANLADRLSDEYNVAPSLFEEALFKQYWNSKGFLMPRLNGLQDNIGQALAESKQDKMSTEQLMSLLEKKAGALPLAKDIGLDKWAKEKGKVTKEEVANYIERNQIVIEYDNNDRNYYGKMGQGRYITPGPHKDYNENFYRWKSGGFQGRRDQPTIQKAKEHVLFYDDIHDAQEAVDYLTELFEQENLIPGEDLYLYDRMPGRNPDATQMFDFFTTKRGGVRKSGVRFRVAKGGVQKKIENLLEDDLVWTTEYMPNSGEINPVGQTLANAPDQPVSDVDVNFVPSHDNWQEEGNILGHTRDTKREFIFNGKEYKSRHLEEVQSDIHQQGRTNGYLPPEKSYGETGRTGRVPDFPFKKAWPSLLFKNEMLKAFDEGMDIISWADGSTHNKRYNLSDIIDSIEVSDYKGRFGVPYEDDLDIRVVDIRTENITGVMQLHVDPTGLIVRHVGQGDYKNKNLSEVIGKQMAKKVMGLDNTNLNPDSVSFPPGIDSAISELQENYFGDDFIVDGSADVKRYNEFRKEFLDRAEYETSKMFGSPEGRKKVIDKIMEANDKLLHSGKSKFSPLEVYLLGKPLSPATTPDGEMSAPKLPNEVRAKLNGLDQYKLREIYEYSNAFTLDSPIGKWPGVSPFLDHAFDLYFYMKKPYGSHIRRTMGNAKHEPTAFAFMNQHVRGFFEWLAGTRDDLNSYENYSESNYAEWPHTTDRGVIGKFEGEGLSIEDPALVNFYDKELVGLATKFAKKMGVPKPVRASTNSYYNEVTPENADAKFNEFIEPMKAVNVDYKVYNTGADLSRNKVAEMFNAHIDGDLEDYIYTDNGDRMYFKNLRTRVLHGKGYIKGTMRFFGKGKPFEMGDLVHLMGKNTHNFEFDKPSQVEKFTKEDFKLASKKNSWAMALPKDRSKIENLGFYMPSLGKDDGNVPSTPLIVRDRANRYKSMSMSQLRKSATEVEQEWREVASPDEPKNYATTDEESKYTQKRNEIVRRHKAINDALKFKSESTRLMPAVPAELRPVDRIAREPGWADSPEMQAYLKDKGDPYFKLPQQEGDEQVFPEVFFHDGSIGLERENYPANYEFKSNAKGGFLTPIFMSTGIDFTSNYGVPALRKYKGDVFPGAMDDTLVPVEGYDKFGPISLITNVVNPFDFRNKDTIRKFVKEISELEYTTKLQEFIDDESNIKEWKNPHTSFNRVTLNQFFKKSPGARIAELFYQLRIPGYMDRMRGTIDEATNVIYDYLQSNVYRSATHEKLANEIKDSISNTPYGDTKEFTSNWVGIEGIVPLIKLAGFDSFTTMEAGTLNVGVFDSKNVKLLESVKQGGLLNSSWMGQDNTFRTNQEMITRDAKVSGNYDPNNPDIRMMPKLDLPKDKSVQYKDSSNTIPIVFKPYSVLSGKKVSMVEADRHDTYYPRMGGPLHAFLQSNNVVAYIGDEGFRPMWANLTWQTISGMIGRIQATDEGHAMIQVMHEMAHRSNKDMFSRTLDSFEQNRANMSDDEINFCANIMDIVIQRNDVDADPILKAQKNFLSALAPYKNHFARGRINEGNKKFKEIVSRYKKAPWWQNPRVQSIASNFNNAFQDMTFNARAEVSNFFIPSDKGVRMPFAPDIKKLLLDEMDYIGAKREDVIGVVQLSKYNLDNSERVFGVYFGNDPEQAKWMTKNEEIIKDQLMKNPKFRPHPSYDWLMLGPANGDYFMFEKPVNPVKIAPDFAKQHEKNWRSKVATMRGDLIKKYGTDKIDPEKKPRQTKKEKKAIEKFLKEANKTPLPQQPSTNIVGAMLRSREPIKIK
jgi:hypothetical protein